MNGNFEIDRGRYPYTGTFIGEAAKVLHTPTQQVTVNIGLPTCVADSVALRLNTQYHAAKAGGHSFDGSNANVAKLIREEAYAAYRRKDILGTVHDRIVLRLDELAA